MWMQDTVPPVERASERRKEQSRGSVERGFELKKKKKNVLTPERVRSWEWEFGTGRGGGWGFFLYNYSWDCGCERDWEGLRAILLFLKCGERVWGEGMEGGREEDGSRV